MPYDAIYEMIRLVKPGWFSVKTRSVHFRIFNQILMSQSVPYCCEKSGRFSCQQNL